MHVKIFKDMLNANISRPTGRPGESMLAWGGSCCSKMSPGCALYHIRCRWAFSHWLILILQIPSSTRVDIYPKVQPPQVSFQEEADLTLCSPLLPLMFQRLYKFPNIWSWAKSRFLCSLQPSGPAVYPGLRPENMDWTVSSRALVWCILALLCCAGLPQKVRELTGWS